MELAMSRNRQSASLQITACALVCAAGCIGPQGAAEPCQCPNTAVASGAAAGSKEAQPAASAPSEPQPVPDPVVPTAALIWDGGGISNLNSIEPPGSWFVYSDKTPN